ncbi:hypothetical protein V2J09_009376 [Rumex salicifolius]
MLWLKIILQDLKIKWEGPMILRSDNKSAISIANNPFQHDKIKHVEIDRHFIKEKIEEDQVADVLTKGLHPSRFHLLNSKLGMEDIYHPA